LDAAITPPWALFGEFVEPGLGLLDAGPQLDDRGIGIDLGVGQVLRLEPRDLVLQRDLRITPGTARLDLVGTVSRFDTLVELVPDLGVGFVERLGLVGEPVERGRLVVLGEHENGHRRAVRVEHAG
jgi:hypothetical protein